MSAYPNPLEMQRQNEMRRIAEAQNRLAMLDQQAQMQAQQQNYMGQNMNFGQPQVQFLGLNGKVIQQVENITANDVPMDSSYAFFPKQDMSEIYAKSWNAVTGNIDTVVFKRIEQVLDAQTNISTPTQENSLYEAVNNALGVISEKVDTLTNRFDEYIGKPKANVRGKKEADAE